MRTYLFAGLLTIGFAAGTLAVAKGDYGNCISNCARAVAEHRAMCGRDLGGDKDALQACLAAAEEHWNMCKGACDAAR
jgi:hypothetical protein